MAENVFLTFNIGGHDLDHVWFQSNLIQTHSIPGAIIMPIFIKISLKLWEDEQTKKPTYMYNCTYKQTTKPIIYTSKKLLASTVKNTGQIATTSRIGRMILHGRYSFVVLYTLLKYMSYMCRKKYYTAPTRSNFNAFDIYLSSSHWHGRRRPRLWWLLL